MELEETTNRAEPADERPRIDEPPPVRLIAVADVTLPAAAGLEFDLDAFYVTLLQFERDSGEAGLVYRAENFRLRILVQEGPIDRDSYRPLQVQVRSVEITELKLREAGIEFVRTKSLYPLLEALVLRDPAGNWVELNEIHLI